MKLMRALIWFFVPVILVVLGASLLTSMPYMRLSEGLYASHENIEFDHSYVSRQLIRYLNYRSDDLTFGANEEDDGTLLREREIVHMEDVRSVYTTLRILAGVGLLLTAFFAVLMWRKSKRYFYETFRDLFYFPTFFIVFIGGWLLIDFGSLFVFFHEFFFFFDEERKWQLSPDDALIQLLPQAFWMVSGILILIFLALGIATIWGLNRRYVKPRIQKGGQ